MTTIAEMKRRFEALDTGKIIEETMIHAEDSIADNNAEQMFTGVKADGSEITPQYAALTIEIKQQKGQPTDRVTLHDTGQFYRGIKAKVQGDNIIIGSSDLKNEKLQKKYSTKIFGLNENFKGEVLRESVQPILKQKINDATGLIMK